jgi:hypothetical protein
MKESIKNIEGLLDYKLKFITDKIIEMLEPFSYIYITKEAILVPII